MGEAVMTTTEFRSDYIRLKVKRIVVEGPGRGDNYIEVEAWQGTHDVGDVIRVGESYKVHIGDSLTIPVSNTITMT